MSKKCWSVASSFDDTEYLTNPPIGSRISRNQDVVFFGVIEIEDLDWLSDQGLQYLERDFMEQDAKIHMDHAKSGLTIKKAYSRRKQDGPRLKIKICCRKILLAHYLTCMLLDLSTLYLNLTLWPAKTDPEKLLIYSQYEQKYVAFSSRIVFIALIYICIESGPIGFSPCTQELFTKA